VVTSIYKSPVSGAVRVGALNLDGDRQSDLVKHGGPLRAVVHVPSEHYAFWRTELPGTDLPWGAFGENLTIEGLVETRSGLAIGCASARPSSSSHGRESRATSSVSAWGAGTWPRGSVRAGAAVST